MSNATPTVRLELETRPECLTLVRSALTGIANELAFDPELSDDLKTAVSEACNNVVLHAYKGEPGPLAIVIKAWSDRVDAVVHDLGSGIHGIASTDDRMGVGLAVISALAERAEFISTPGEGTEVRMAFGGHVGRAPARTDVPGQISLDGAPPRNGPRASVLVRLSPPSMVTTVLGPLARGLAASAHFTVARFPDLSSLGDALCEHARVAAAGDELGFTITPSTRRLELMIGPFRKHSSESLKADLTGLADELDISPDGDAEAMRLVVSDSR